MPDLVAAETPRQDPVALTTTPGSRRTLRILITLAVLLALLTPAGAWWVGHRAVVQVGSATGVPVCEGTVSRTIKDSDGFREVGIPLTDGFACTFPIKLINHSDRRLTIESITIPVAGPHGGGRFQVTHLADMPLADDDQIDAVMRLGRSLGPGEEQLINAAVSFRDTGCTSKGMWMQVVATVEVRALLASYELSVDDLPRFIGTAETSCDS